MAGDNAEKVLQRLQETGFLQAEPDGVYRVMRRGLDMNDLPPGFELNTSGLAAEIPGRDELPRRFHRTDCGCVMCYTRGIGPWDYAYPGPRKVKPRAQSKSLGPKPMLPPYTLPRVIRLGATVRKNSLRRFPPRSRPRPQTPAPAPAPAPTPAPSRRPRLQGPAGGTGGGYGNGGGDGLPPLPSLPPPGGMGLGDPPPYRRYE